MVMGRIGPIGGSKHAAIALHDVGLGVLGLGDNLPDSKFLSVS
jgi:hypothetical protein